MPPTNAAGSLMSHQVTEPGPNSPGSPRWSKVSASGSGAWLKSPTADSVMRSRQPGLTAGG